MKEIIEKINKLDGDIKNMESFLRHIKNSQGFYQGNDSKENYSDKLSLRSYIYTGSDNPQYEVSLNNKDVIKLFINAGKVVLEKELELKKEELSTILPTPNQA